MTPPDTLSRCEAVVTPAPTGVQLRLECETVGLAPYRAHGTDSRPRSIGCVRVSYPKAAPIGLLNGKRRRILFGQWTTSRT